MPKNYAEVVAKGTGVFFAATILSTIIGYLLRIYLARNLSVAEYGLFYAVMSFISSIVVFRNIGFSAALAKFIPEFVVKKQPDSIRHLIYLIVFLQSVLTLLIALPLFLLSDSLAMAIFENKHASLVLKIFSIEMIFTTFYAIFNASLQGFQRIKQISLLNVCFISVVLLITLIFSAFGLNASRVALAYLGSSIVVAALSFLFLVRTFPEILKIELRVEKERIMRILKFGAPVFIGTVSWSLLSNFDTVLLTVYRTVEEVAYYQIAIPVARVLMFFASSLTVTLLPVISELWSGGKFNYVSKSVTLLTKLSLIGIIPFSLVFVTFPEIVINLFFGSEYLPATLPLQLLSIGCIFLAIYSIISSVLTGIGKPAEATKVILTAFLINLALNLILIPNYGIFGSSLSALVSYVSCFILALHVVKREMKRMNVEFALPLISLIKIIIAGMLTTVLIFILKGVVIAHPWVEFSLILTASAAVYALLILNSGCVTPEELRLLTRMNVLPTVLIKLAMRLIRKGGKD